MPKIAKELSALEVKRLTRPGFHAVGGVQGLLLQVTPTGARSWVLRTMVGAKRRAMGLGSYPAVSLADARQKAQEQREEVKAGIDPVQVRRQARSVLLAEQHAGKTFSQCVTGFMDDKSSEWRNPKHRQQWLNTLTQYAYPVIGDMLVRDIDLPHVLQILRPLWTTKTETASRVRGRIEAVLDWATTSKFRTGENPARWRGHLDNILAKPTKVAKVKHHEAMELGALPGFMKALREKNGMGARALEFVILTAARSGEVRGATWAEIDLDSAEWNVPGERMKAGKPHRVPLSKPAVKLLQALPRVEGCDLVFPSSKNTPLSDMTLTKAMRDMGLTAVPHGFRSTFKDWASERTSYPNEVSEMALAHVIENKVEAAYRRGELFDKRKRMMDDWARFCEKPTPTGATVTPMRKRA